jgi:hypothetical protein
VNATRQQLEAAYRATRYTVQAPGGGFELQVDLPSPPLAALLTSRGFREAAYLTACNPASAVHSAAENQARTARLALDLAASGWVVFDGQAIDPEGKWPPECSFLVLGANVAAAAGLGRRHGQNAILVAGPEAIPRLHWLVAEPAPLPGP